MIKNQNIIMKRKVFVILSFLFILPTALFSWGTHYLIMDQILEHSSMRFISREVESESLDSFIKKEKNSLKVLFDEFAAWEESRGSKRFKKVEFHPETASVIEFLKAARLNPTTRFLEVERILPGFKSMIGNVSVSSITPYLLDHPELPARFQSTIGKKLNLKTFYILLSMNRIGEWIMTLWSFQEYGYGRTTL